MRFCCGTSTEYSPDLEDLERSEFFMSTIAFSNGDGVRVEDGEVINIRTGFRAKLASGTALTGSARGQRVRLHGIGERASELIDLSQHGDGQETACFRNTVLGPTEQVSLLASRLPTDLNVSSRVARRKLFTQFDVNGNGYLSLAEVDRGVRDVLHAEALFNCKPAIMRSFKAAKAMARTRSAYGEDYVEDGREFRLLLLYLRRYFELHAMFTAIDMSGDHRIDRAEVAAALPQVLSNVDTHCTGCVLRTIWL